MGERRLSAFYFLFYQLRLIRVYRIIRKSFSFFFDALKTIPIVIYLPAKLKNANNLIAGDFILLRNKYKLSQGADSTNQERCIILADINEIYSGLGSCLRVLAPAWNYAEKTGRVLVIDWRGNPYKRNLENLNLFPELFELPDFKETGVRIIADNSIGSLRFPQPVLGPKQAFINPNGETHKLPCNGLKDKYLHYLIYKNKELRQPTIIPSFKAFWKPFGEPLISFKEGKQIYGSLKLKQRWALEVERFYSSNFSETQVIGVHVRHGNGEENYRTHFKSRVIKDLQALLVQLTAIINKKGTRYFKNRFKVFLCTDSDLVVETFRIFFPDLITRKVWRPETGKGMDFDLAWKQKRNGTEVAADALIDMYLLAKCNMVFISKYTAFASHIPYIAQHKPVRFYYYSQKQNFVDIEKKIYR